MDNTQILEETRFNELFDFPMSWDWHRYYSTTEIIQDPGPIEIEDDSNDDSG